MAGETERNVAAFNQEQIVAQYREMTQLTPVEETIFERFLRPGMDVLDLGVGTGRTTDALRASGGRYVGLDYAEGMVNAARRTHPGVDFRVADARDLSDFPDTSFDATVYSFNGIDYLHPVSDRVRCLAECRRVLRPGGLLILSSHNARMILPAPDLRGLELRGRLRRLAGWLARAPKLLWRRARCSTLWKGHGYVFDPVDGGLTTYEATPEHVEAEARAAGFTMIEVVPSTRRWTPRRLFVPWYYYVFVASN